MMKLICPSFKRVYCFATIIHLLAHALSFQGLAWYKEIENDDDDDDDD